jgi:hypothetical protein
MSEREAPQLVAVTKVKAGREAAFEAFVTDVVIPAVRRGKPHLADMWQAVRPAPDQSGDGARAYIFLFYGDTPIDEWGLAPMFATAFGEQAGAQRLTEFEELLDGGQMIYVLDGAIR